MVARTLITTADERTWPPDATEPVLFLGEWCRRYTRREVWNLMDFKVVPFHWNDRKKLMDDYLILQNLYENVLVELSTKLNELHKTNHSLKYWRIVLGPWLGYFMHILFDRWQMLKFAIENYNISKVYVLKKDISFCVPNDMSSFIEKFVCDEWNESIYGLLLKLCWVDNIKIIEIPCTINRKTNTNSRFQLKQLLKKAIHYFNLQYNRLLSKNDLFFFISSYIPLRTELKLQIRLGQFPKIWRTNMAQQSELEPSKREWVFSKSGDKNTFEHVARNFIPKHIPASYLEGYKNLSQIPKKLKWPISPLAVFTSNSFYSNEIFKIWVANKTEGKTQLIIGQHGGHYGISKFSFEEDHETTIADHWLSWGWRNTKNPKIKPAINFKTIEKKYIKYNPNGGLLMVGMTLPRYSYQLFAAPISSQWLEYFKEQKRFAMALPINIRKKMLVRLHKEDYGWDQIERWKDSKIKINLDEGKSDINSLIRKSRLYLSTYNATTYLESLSLNMPTIIFWKPEHWELNMHGKKYAELLIKEKILHFTPESAAQHVTKVWNNLEKWWQSKSVQKARLIFCEEYSASFSSPIDGLACLIGKMTNKSSNALNKNNKLIKHSS